MSSDAQKITRLKEFVSTLPEKSGVYLMKNQRGHIIYIGKAINLRSRVKNYLQAGGDGRLLIPYLLESLETIETIVCENETQSLILERDLIRTHQPPFNIKLKDDKSYLMVKIDRNNQWPRLETVRKRFSDGASYFGPYVSSYQLREVLSLIRRVIPLRTCSDTVLNNRARPCLEYQIKRCLAPCVLNVDPQEYDELVRMAIAVLNGKGDKIALKIEQQMEDAAMNLNFELAASLRDKLEHLKQWVLGHKNVFHQGEDRHAFALYRDGLKATLNVLQTRGGRIAHSENFSFDSVWMDDGEFLETVIQQYYSKDGLKSSKALPKEIIIPVEPSECEMLGALLTKIRASQGNDTPPEIIHPKRGSRYRLLELARINSQTHFATTFRSEASYSQIVNELQRLLGLSQAPRRIECLDISNLQGNNIVGAIVVFTDGVPDRQEYRRYKLSFDGQPDDFRSVFEVTTRRLSLAMETGELPDLLLIDGGRGQLSSALKARDAVGLRCDIASIAKIRTGGQRERIFTEHLHDPIELVPNEPITLLLQRIRDEVHRFVLNYHRQRRSNDLTSSSLDQITGIGAARRNRLLAHFGSMAALVAAEPEEIAKIGRMSLLLANQIKKLKV